jgi:hypothetical protein
VDTAFAKFVLIKLLLRTILVLAVRLMNSNTSLTKAYNDPYITTRFIAQTRPKDVNGLES